MDSITSYFKYNHLINLNIQHLYSLDKIAQLDNNYFSYVLFDGKVIGTHNNI